MFHEKATFEGNFSHFIPQDILEIKFFEKFSHFLKVDYSIYGDLWGFINNLQRETAFLMFHKGSSLTNVKKPWNIKKLGKNSIFALKNNHIKKVGIV